MNRNADAHAFYDASTAFWINQLVIGATHRACEQAIRDRARVLSLAMRIIDAERDDQTLTLRQIIVAVQTIYGVTTTELQSGRKQKRLVEARQVVMYLGRLYAGATNREIGVPLGGRDPSTAWNGYATIKRRLARGDTRLAADIEVVKAELGIK